MEISHLGFMSLQIVVWFLLLTRALGNYEVTALIHFKNGLKDPKNILGSWDSSLIDPCNWFHITCDNSNLVTRIDLGNEGLQGTISPFLGELTNLQYLELYANRLIGNIPPELGNLVNLKSLDLYQNNLVGEIPKTFGNLKSLLFLRLNNNKLDGCARVSTLIQLRKYHPNIQITVFAGNPKLRFCAID